MLKFTNLSRTIANNWLRNSKHARTMSSCWTKYARSSRGTLANVSCTTGRMCSIDSTRYWRRHVPKCPTSRRGSSPVICLRMASSKCSCLPCFSSPPCSLSIRIRGICTTQLNTWPHCSYQLTFMSFYPCSICFTCSASVRYSSIAYPLIKSKHCCNVCFI